MRLDLGEPADVGQPQTVVSTGSWASPPVRSSSAAPQSNPGSAGRGPRDAGCVGGTADARRAPVDPDHRPGRPSPRASGPAGRRCRDQRQAAGRGGPPPPVRAQPQPAVRPDARAGSRPQAPGSQPGAGCPEAGRRSTSRGYRLGSARSPRLAVKRPSIWPGEPGPTPGTRQRDRLRPSSGAQSAGSARAGSWTP